MADYPDFHKLGMQWTRREWAAREYEFKSWLVSSTVDAGGSWSGFIYTIPSGKRLYVCDIQVKAVQASDWDIYVEPSPYLFSGASADADSKNINTFSLSGRSIMLQ